MSLGASPIKNSNSMLRDITIYMRVFWVRLARRFGYTPSTEPIPKGVYCYEPIEFPSEENGFVYKTRHCPYAKSLNNGNDACLFLGYVGWDPAFSDSCKICSIKNPREPMEL